MGHNGVHQGGELSLGFDLHVLDLACHIRNLKNLYFFSTLAVNFNTDRHVAFFGRFSKLHLENDLAEDRLATIHNLVEAKIIFQTRFILTGLEIF